MICSEILNGLGPFRLDISMAITMPNGSANGSVSVGDVADRLRFALGAVLYIVFP